MTANSRRDAGATKPRRAHSLEIWQLSERIPALRLQRRSVSIGRDEEELATAALFRLSLLELMRRGRCGVFLLGEVGL